MSMDAYEHMVSQRLMAMEAEKVAADPAAMRAEARYAKRVDEGMDAVSAFGAVGKVLDARGLYADASANVRKVMKELQEGMEGLEAGVKAVAGSRGLGALLGRTAGAHSTVLPPMPGTFSVGEVGFSAAEVQWVTDSVRAMQVHMLRMFTDCVNLSTTAGSPQHLKAVKAAAPDLVKELQVLQGQVTLLEQGLAPSSMAQIQRLEADKRTLEADKLALENTSAFLTGRQKSLEAQIKGLKEDKKDLKTDKQDLQREKSELQSKNGELNKKVTDLKTSVTNFTIEDILPPPEPAATIAAHDFQSLDDGVTDLTKSFRGMKAKCERVMAEVLNVTATITQDTEDKTVVESNKMVWPKTTDLESAHTRALLFETNNATSTIRAEVQAFDWGDLDVVAPSDENAESQGDTIKGSEGLTTGVERAVLGLLLGVEPQLHDDTAASLPRLEFDDWDKAIASLQTVRVKEFETVLEKLLSTMKERSVEDSTTEELQVSVSLDAAVKAMERQLSGLAAIKMGKVEVDQTCTNVLNNIEAVLNQAPATTDTEVPDDSLKDQGSVEDTLSSLIGEKLGELLVKVKDFHVSTTSKRLLELSQNLVDQEIDQAEYKNYGDTFLTCEQAFEEYMIKYESKKYGYDELLKKVLEHQKYVEHCTAQRKFDKLNSDCQAFFRKHNKCVKDNTELQVEFKALENTFVSLREFKKVQDRERLQILDSWLKDLEAQPTASSDEKQPGPLPNIDEDIKVLEKNLDFIVTWSETIALKANVQFNDILTKLINKNETVAMEPPTGEIYKEYANADNLKLQQKFQDTMVSLKEVDISSSEELTSRFEELVRHQRALQYWKDKAELDGIKNAWLKVEGIITEKALPLEDTAQNIPQWSWTDFSGALEDVVDLWLGDVAGTGSSETMATIDSSLDWRAPWEALDQVFEAIVIPNEPPVGILSSNLDNYTKTLNKLKRQANLEIQFRENFIKKDKKRSIEMTAVFKDIEREIGELQPQGMDTFKKHIFSNVFTSVKTLNELYKENQRAVTDIPKTLESMTEWLSRYHNTGQGILNFFKNSGDKINVIFNENDGTFNLKKNGESLLGEAVPFIPSRLILDQWKGFTPTTEWKSGSELPEPWQNMSVVLTNAMLLFTIVDTLFMDVAPIASSMDSRLKAWIYQVPVENQFKKSLGVLQDAFGEGTVDVLKKEDEVLTDMTKTDNVESKASGSEYLKESLLRNLGDLGNTQALYTFKKGVMAQGAVAELETLASSIIEHWEANLKPRLLDDGDLNLFVLVEKGDRVEKLKVNRGEYNQISNYQSMFENLASQKPDVSFLEITKWFEGKDFAERSGWLGFGGNKEVVQKNKRLLLEKVFKVGQTQDPLAYVLQTSRIVLLMRLVLTASKKLEEICR